MTPQEIATQIMDDFTMRGLAIASDEDLVPTEEAKTAIVRALDPANALLVAFVDKFYTDTVMGGWWPEAPESYSDDFMLGVIYTKMMSKEGIFGTPDDIIEDAKKALILFKAML